MKVRCNRTEDLFMNESESGVMVRLQGAEEKKVEDFKCLEGTKSVGKS